MKSTRNLWWTLLLWPLLLTARDNHANDHVQWSHDIAAFGAADRAHPPAPDAVLFIGSSSIRLWTTLATDFPQVRTINRGFGGSEIDDSTYFADRIVAPYRPGAIVMYAGDNDLADGDTSAARAEDFAGLRAQGARGRPGRADRLHRDQAERGAPGAAAPDPPGQRQGARLGGLAAWRWLSGRLHADARPGWPAAIEVVWR